MSYFMLSAAGSYETDGRNRGMTKEEASNYGMIMGVMEGASEMVGVSNFLKAGSALKKGAFREALRGYGLNMADNAIQEAVIDPVDELTAAITSGKTKNDYSNVEGWITLGHDMVQDGIDGALSSLLMDGVGASINSSVYLYDKIKNGKNINRQDIVDAYTDIQNNPDIDVEEHFKNSFDYQKNKVLNDDRLYMTVDMDNQGNIGFTQVIGEPIKFNDKRININPVVVYDNSSGYYNVIDGNTGTKLDTTPYSVKDEAINSFNDKISKVDQATIKNINTAVTKTRMEVLNKSNEINKNTTNISNDFYIKTIDNQLYTAREFQNIINDMSNQNREYTTQQYDNISKTVNSISDRTLYNSTDANHVFDTVSDNIKNVEVIEQSGNRYLNSLDNEGNVAYQQKLDSKVYSGKKIKNIVNTAIQKADMTYLNTDNNTQTANTPQSSSEPNTSSFYSNETNYAVQDIKKVIEPFNKQESYSKDEMAEVWNEEVSDNNYDAYYDSNGNIERYIAIEEDGNNIVINQYDNNDNVVKSEVIPSENGRYRASDIQDTINRVASLYDENRPIKGQRDIEVNEVKSMKKKIDNKKDTKITKKIEEYIAKNPNLETNINISTDIVNDINIKEIKQMEAYKMARDLFGQVHKRKFQNNNTKTNIYVTNSDIKESINTTYTYTEQRKYLKENIAIYSQLDNIIENAELISNTNELKGRQNYQLWEYYAMPINIDNNKFIVQFDTVQREDGETHFRVERLYKITEEGGSTTVVPTKKSATRFTVEPPSTKNSISQNNQTVKTSTNPKTNKSQINTTIKSLEDIKTKYKNQTDQLNIFENKDNTISINNMVVKQNLRRKGIGQSILNDIIDYADKNGKTITLTPTSQYMTKDRLTKWYKKNGFVENKGRNTDFSISDTMYRLPKNNTQNNQNVKDDGVRAMKKNTSRNKTNTTNNSKDLIAQHNTSEEKLMEALDLGALPVPSIAITKSDTPISNYGDITLLFSKDTINPTDRRNVAYNSDIYSTRRPQTVNSLDKNKVKTFEKSMNDKGISYGYISQIEEYIQDNDFTRAKDTIRYELQKANPDITEQEIEDSFTEAIEIIKDKRILKEGIDPYTSSGNRKTIEQMSVPYTLDNIVRLMTKKSNKGSESKNFAGLPEVRANLSQQFKNIEEMHQQENNLVSTEEMQKVKEQLNDEFYNLIDEIGKYDKVERYFGSTDTVANALNETAKAKNISKEVLENELDFVSITNIPDKILQKAVDFLNSLKNVPTEYFEVKPQRAVGLNEIQSAVIPKNTSKELIDKLKENNIPITYYDTQQERNKIITNETEDKNIRFAKKQLKQLILTTQV